MYYHYFCSIKPSNVIEYDHNDSNRIMKLVFGSHSTIVETVPRIMLPGRYILKNTCNNLICDRQLD